MGKSAAKGDENVAISKQFLKKIPSYIKSVLPRTLIVTTSFVAVSFISILFLWKFFISQEENNNLRAEKARLISEMAYAMSSSEEILAEKDLLQESTQNELNEALAENEVLSKDLDDFSSHAKDYLTLKSKTSDYKNLGVDIGSAQDDLNTLYSMLLEEKYTEFDTKISEVNTMLAANYSKYQQQIAVKKSTPVNPTTPPPSGVIKRSSRNQYSYYEQKYVSTSNGTFLVDMISISTANPSLRIITDTMDTQDNCWEQGCAFASLATYVSQNSGFAGIHGSYFCPPDYASCVDKPYSFDLAVYNSRLGKWVNPYLKQKGLLVFQGKVATLYNGQSDSIIAGMTPTAAIANHPALIQNGSFVYSGLDSKQANVKGYRGGIGITDDSRIILVISRSSTVPDLATVMSALGAKDALNLDGGGSSALYYDGYRVGPGRLLPNAIVFGE